MSSIYHLKNFDFFCVLIAQKYYYFSEIKCCFRFFKATLNLSQNIKIKILIMYIRALKIKVLLNTL